jgi:hypothetical protein
VPNQPSVLAHYLSSAHAEIWPNDSGFETLEMRRAIWERGRAQREKALAEEALQARQEAGQAQFVALLVQAPLQWLKQEAKRREEDELIWEWMDRAAYGAHVPAVEEPDKTLSS